MKRSKRRQVHLNKTKNGELIKKGCSDKKKYSSEMDALGWSRHSNDIRNQHIRYGTYFCSFCYKWHLTTLKY